MRIRRSSFLIILSLIGFLRPCLADNVQQPIVLRGWIELDETILFSIQGTQGEGSAWVRLKQPILGGQIVDYNREDYSVLFQNTSGAQWIKMPKQNTFASSIVFEKQLAYTPKQRENLKPYDTVPEGLKKLPARALVSYLAEGGYEIPDHIITQARADRITEAIEEKKVEAKGGYQQPDGVYLGPRAPTFTTSMTRDEKIARGIVGYTDL